MRAPMASAPKISPKGATPSRMGSSARIPAQNSWLRVAALVPDSKSTGSNSPRSIEPVQDAQYSRSGEAAEISR